MSITNAPVGVESVGIGGMIAPMCLESLTGPSMKFSIDICLKYARPGDG